MKRSLVAITMIATLCVVGCTKEARTPTSIEISPTIYTRVSGVHFETNDCIGLTVVCGSEPYAENRMMTYNGSAFTASGLLWYNDLNVKSTLTAYYPYSASGAPRSFSVAVDQTSGCEGSDLLSAVRKDVIPATTPVSMLFKHLLSQLSIVVTNNSDAEVTSVVIGGFVPTADVDLTAQTVRVATVAPADVKAFEITANASYRAILVPQQAALTVTIFTSDGKSRSKTISGAKLESGLRYDLEVLVTNVDISLSLSGDINDWGEGGELVDDGSLTYEDETYRTESVGGKVWMVENLRVKPTGVVLGSGMWYPQAGAGVVAQLGMLYDYSTAMAGETYVSGTPIRGICPPGWHLPDLAELTAFSVDTNALGFMVAVGFLKPGDIPEYNDAVKSYLMGTSTSVSNVGKCDALIYEPTASPPNQLRPKPVDQTYGISVRCVKN